MTPLPFMVELPTTSPASPVSQMMAPVAGSSWRIEPWKVVPLTVVSSAATNSRLPSQTAAPSHWLSLAVLA